MFSSARDVSVSLGFSAGPFSDAVLSSLTAPSARVVVVVAVIGARLANLKVGRWKGAGQTVA